MTTIPSVLRFRGKQASISTERAIKNALEVLKGLPEGARASLEDQRQAAIDDLGLMRSAISRNEPATMTFSPIGKPGLTVRVDTDLLSARDKVELFRTLMDDLGITERFRADPDGTAKAQEIVTEQWNRHWDLP